MGATSIDWLGRLADLENAIWGGPNVAGTAKPIATASQPPVVVLTGSTDAIAAKTGTVVINTAGVDAATLANPIAGGYGVGDDGKNLRIISNTANAHTITTGAHGINGNKNIATFGAAIGNIIDVVAWNGAWYMVAQIGITLSGS